MVLRSSTTAAEGELQRMSERYILTVVLLSDVLKNFPSV
jgi:hypothetical protein